MALFHRPSVDLDADLRRAIAEKLLGYADVLSALLVGVEGRDGRIENQLALILAKPTRVPHDPRRHVDDPPLSDLSSICDDVLRLLKTAGSAITGLRFLHSGSTLTAARCGLLVFERSLWLESSNGGEPDEEVPVPARAGST